MANPGEWQGPLQALEKSLSRSKYRNLSQGNIDYDSISMTTPEGTCEVCGHKNVHARGLCKTCWRIDVSRNSGG